jgi:hypothetical protein
VLDVFVGEVRRRRLELLFALASEPRMLGERGRAVTALRVGDQACAEVPANEAPGNIIANRPKPSGHIETWLGSI